MSCLIISHALLMNLKLNPFGPGALSESHEATSFSISSHEKGGISCEACSFVTYLKFKFSKSGLLLCSSFNSFSKYAVASRPFYTRRIINWMPININASNGIFPPFVRGNCMKEFCIAISFFEPCYSRVMFPVHLLPFDPLP